MPDENRVFDVTKPKHVSPSATSKPVIVGHHPLASDPMVNDAGKPADEPTHIQIMDAPHDTAALEGPEPSPLDNSPAPPDTAAIFSEPEAEEAEKTPPIEPSELGAADTPADQTAPLSHADDEAPSEPAVFPEPENSALAPDTGTEPAAETPPPADTPADIQQTDSAAVPQPHIEGLHFTQANYKRSWWKPILLVVLILLIGGYLAIDSGLVDTGINLPYHFFSQKQAPAASSSTQPTTGSNQPAASTPSIPAGFKNYQLSGTNLTFAAPTDWGAPSSAPEPGYSKRGADNKSDGTHAYLVSFASNKDIQLAVTSSQYLPPARTALYYDYLQWCVGTNDDKIYRSTLHFTTAGGVDTPSTIACDQGPLADAVKLNASTIVQAKVTDTAGKTLGDIYTENLNNPNLVVIRVKDASMTNGAAIKQLLSTVLVPSQ